MNELTSEFTKASRKKNGKRDLVLRCTISISETVRLVSSDVVSENNQKQGGGLFRDVLGNYSNNHGNI